MNKHKLRHLILKELYSLPDKPTSEEYPNSTYSHLLKERLKASISEQNYLSSLKLLSSKEEIVMNRMSDGTFHLMMKRNGEISYLDGFYLNKKKEDSRKNTQHYLRVIAWSAGIILGTATFMMNLYKLNQEIYIVPLLEDRIKSLESSTVSEGIPKTSPHCRKTLPI
jgi:hypothetical protein